MSVRRLLGAACAAGGAGSAVGQIDVWLTRGDQASLLEPRPALTFEAGPGHQATAIGLRAGERFQTMVGFGAAVTDSAAWLIQNELDAAARAALLDELFSPVDGIGLSFVRVPMGASDFALAPYTYNDLPGGQTDTDLSEFSIAHDEAYIIPTLLAARARNPDLKLMATPWSPPAWMKNTGSLFGGTLRSQYYPVYAQYFVRFLEDYAAAGLPVYALSVQNEPLHNSASLPSMGMANWQQATFIGEHLGPALAAANLAPRVLAYDHNWDQWNYPVVVYNDAEAGPFTHGAAFHAYAGDVENQSLLHDMFPGKEIHFTEISGGGWSTDFGNNLVWLMHNVVIGAPRNWARSVALWNLALDQDSGPFIPGGCDNCRGVVTIDTGSGAVTREVEYYGLAHASRFVRPGAVRIGADSLDGVIETVAYRNPEGSEVLLALNADQNSRWFHVQRGAAHFDYRLTGRSVATFVWTPPAADLDGDCVVGLEDLLLVLSHFGGGPRGDVDGDGDVDLNDLLTVLTTFGASCAEL